MFFFLKYSFRTGGVTTPIQYFSSQRGSAVRSTKWEQNPPVAHRSNPNGLVLNKEDVKRLETPTVYYPKSPPRSLFLINRKITRWMPIKLRLLYPLSYLVSTPKGDNRVEEQEILKFLLVNFRG